MTRAIRAAAIAVAATVALPTIWRTCIPVLARWFPLTDAERIEVRDWLYRLGDRIDPDSETGDEDNPT